MFEFQMQRPHCPVNWTVALGILLVNLTLFYWLIREKLSVARTSMFSNQIDPFNLSGCPSAQVFFQDPFNWFVYHCVGKYILIAISGRIVHHFCHRFYRMDRSTVKPNGRAYFRCSVRQCKARFVHKYDSKCKRNIQGDLTGSAPKSSKC